MDANLNESAQVSELPHALVTKDECREKADCLESAISFAIEWANLGGG